MIILLLSIADLIWSFSAWVFDFGKLTTIPYYLLPFILTCPIYPLLLSISLFQIWKKRRVNLFVLYLGILGSVVYGFGAVFYYPVYMSLNGFDWYAFGGIFWVLFYGIQGAYLLFSKQRGFSLYSLFAAGLFVATKIKIDYFTRTYGYIVDQSFPQLYFAIIIEIMALVLVISFAKIYSSRHEH